MNRNINKRNNRNTAVDDIQYRYGLNEQEMMRLFGTSSAEQRRMLKERPELRGAVLEMTGLMSRF